MPSANLSINVPKVEVKPIKMNLNLGFSANDKHAPTSAKIKTDWDNGIAEIKHFFGKKPKVNGNINVNMGGNMNLNPNVSLNMPQGSISINTPGVNMKTNG